MIVQGILDNRLPADILCENNIENILDDILDVMEWFQRSEKNSATLSYDGGSSGLFSQMIGNVSFDNWLYNPANHAGISRDIIREFVRRIERSRPVDEKQYHDWIATVEAQNRGRDGELVLSIHTDSKNFLYVSAVSHCWNAKQWYLANFVPRSDFLEEARASFPYLFFHNSISTSIHTLKVDFVQERPLIVEHLKAISNFSDSFFKLRESGCSKRDICKNFEEETMIECSPQAGRAGTRNLFWEFNDANGTPVRICCECHTKLKFRDMNKEKQDRIYFDAGAADVENGKILIAYIGKHL